ncbi:MAG: hypothetical protein ACREQT_18095 [Candidatus Binataceae bacterium]
MGCASNQAQHASAAASVQSVQYFPFQVKGYEDTYPKRQVAVVAVTDARDFKDASAPGHEPFEGHPAIGAVFAEDGQVSQRLYGPALDELVGAALVQAAQEAGMSASASSLPLAAELAARKADYVISARITRCWVSKRRGPARWPGPSWRAEAVVVLDTTIYKPPFDVAFWQGESSSTYDDPPAAAGGAFAGDETEIYDQPGEVLSVALTRAVAGLFQRDDLRTLIAQDTIRLH